MKFLKFTIASIVFIAAFGAALQAQSVAVVEVNAADDSVGFSRGLTGELKQKFRVAEKDQTHAAFRSFEFENPFNLSKTEVRSAANAVGANFLVIVNEKLQKRAVFNGSDSFEAYAAIFVFDGKSGANLDFSVNTATENSAEASQKALLAKLPQIAKRIFEATATKYRETTHPETITEIRSENLQAPLPYKRLKPKYTNLAFLYSVTATVEIAVDIDVDGRITNTEILRYGGFGLDESVEKCVREMTWRAGLRNGKNIPARVILQYNFRKPPKKEIEE